MSIKEIEAVCNGRLEKRLVVNVGTTIEDAWPTRSEARRLRDDLDRALGESIPKKMRAIIRADIAPVVRMLTVDMTPLCDGQEHEDRKVAAYHADGVGSIDEFDCTPNDGGYEIVEQLIALAWGLA